MGSALQTCNKTLPDAEQQLFHGQALYGAQLHNSSKYQDTFMDF
jgi:hypothetical protein